MKALIAVLALSLAGCASWRTQMTVTYEYDTAGNIVSKTVTHRGKAAIRAAVALDANEVESAKWDAIQAYARAGETMSTASGEATWNMMAQSMMRTQKGQAGQSYFAGEADISRSRTSIVQALIYGLPGWIALAGGFGGDDRETGDSYSSSVSVGGDLIASNSGSASTGEGPGGAQRRALQIGGIGNTAAFESEVMLGFRSHLCRNNASGLCTTDPGRNSILAKDLQQPDFSGFDSERDNGFRLIP